MLSAAQHEARSKFESSRSICTGSEDAMRAIEHAIDVATVLRQNVVQGEQEEPDKFSEGYR